ncbi:unnamed protein product [Pelagomonas calceolata]|uniref:Uncharacterized protein n=1 Tax=Pelagomonas calceolata TaxID=35677 RepID=A0A8J2STV2_9STRA|nr:unnamed protein product [Pelagomonas calceolata]
MVHGDGTRADGRSSSFLCHIEAIVRSGDREGAETLR